MKVCRFCGSAKRDNYFSRGEPVSRCADCAGFETDVIITGPAAYIWREELCTTKALDTCLNCGHILAWCPSDDKWYHLSEDGNGNIMPLPDGLLRFCPDTDPEERLKAMPAQGVIRQTEEQVA